MPYYRDNAPVGQTVTLTATFRDGTGALVDVDAGYPNVYIYNPDVSSDTIDTAVATRSFGGADVTILSASVTKISTGYYEASWSVPAGSTAGDWRDIWDAEINGVPVTSDFVITVVRGGTVTTQIISGNTLIVITLAEEITATSGNALEEDTYLTFSTKYNPYYASPDLVRLECGSWLDTIPDDTISLMIHWSSIEADMIATADVRGPLFENARTKFVIFDCALRCLTVPVDLGGKQKQLGDLMIRNDSKFVEIISELKSKREEWFRVVNARGSIVPGQSFAPSTAVKGRYDPDRRRQGRLWWPPTDYPYLQPGTNAKVRKKGQRKYKKGFLDLGPEEP